MVDGRTREQDDGESVGVRIVCRSVTWQARAILSSQPTVRTLPMQKIADVPTRLIRAMEAAQSGLPRGSGSTSPAAPPK